MAERINKENFSGKVLENALPVLVDFYSDSCVPCKMLSPLLGDLEDETEGKLAIYKINVSYDGEIAERYGVQGTPTLIYFESGAEKARKLGAPKRDDLYDWVAELAGLEL